MVSGEARIDEAIPHAPPIPTAEDAEIRRELLLHLV
jgi:hypothetical protein